MTSEVRLNKTLLKIELLIIKVIPMIISFIYMLNTLLSLFGIDLSILSLLGGMSILPTIFLYVTSYTFKFCEYHRIFLHYIVINDIISYLDYYTDGVYFSNRNLLILHILLIGLFLFLILYLKLNKHEQFHKVYCNYLLEECISKT